MPLLPSAAAPFGPLQPLHEHILRNAKPITLANIHHVAVLPNVVLLFQSWLMLKPGTRLYRIAVSVLALYLIYDAWFNHRFIGESFIIINPHAAEPEYDVFNNLLGVAFLHLAAKSIEFALLVDPVTDPYTKKGRSSWLSANDLLFNSRWIGLRPVALDPLKSEAPTPKSVPAANGHGPSNGELREEPGEVAEDRWLPPSPSIKRTRLQAFLRHLTLAFIYGNSLEIFLALLKHYGADTVALPIVPPGGYDRFIAQRYVVLPRSQYAFQAHPIAVDLATKTGLGGGVWLMLQCVYHTVAAVYVGTGLYEAEAWERNLFGDAWNAASLLEFWGKGWHQLFRVSNSGILCALRLTEQHHFLLASGIFTRIMGLDPQNPLLLPLSFLWSGALHALGELNMTVPPEPSQLFLFFVYCGVACCLEVAFKKITGRKVGGMAGKMWKNAFLAVASSGAVRAEMESGLGGAWLPCHWGLGQYAARLVIRYIVDNRA